MWRSSDEDECRSDRIDYFFDYRNFCVVFFAGIFANAERAVLKAAVRQQKAALRKKPQRGLLLSCTTKTLGVARREAQRGRACQSDELAPLEPVLQKG